MTDCTNNASGENRSSLDEEYRKYENDEDFMCILDHLRNNVFDCEDEVYDALDMDYAVILKHFRLAQAIVAREIEEGSIDNESTAMLNTLWSGYFGR